MALFVVLGDTLKDGCALNTVGLLEAKRDLLLLELEGAVPNIVEDAWVVGISEDLVLKLFTAKADAPDGLKRLLFCVTESDLEVVNIDADGLDVAAPNTDVDSVEIFPNVGLVTVVDVTAGVKMLLLDILLNKLLETLELVVLLVAVALLLGLLPLVRFARKSKDDGCVLLNPPNPLKTGLLACNKKKIHVINYI